MSGLAGRWLLLKLAVAGTKRVQKLGRLHRHHVVLVVRGCTLPLYLPADCMLANSGARDPFWAE